MKIYSYCARIAYLSASTEAGEPDGHAFLLEQTSTLGAVDGAYGRT